MVQETDMEELLPQVCFRILPDDNTEKHASQHLVVGWPIDLYTEGMAVRNSLPSPRQ